MTKKRKNYIQEIRESVIKLLVETRSQDFSPYIGDTRAYSLNH